MQTKIVKLVLASLKYAESYCSAVDQVTKERKYLGMITGFSLESTIQFVKMIVIHDLAQYFAIEVDQVVGWCDIIPKSIAGFTHVGVLGTGVLKEYRHLGIGSRLMNKTLRHAKEINRLEKVELEVYESNTVAINFYEKFGFGFEGKRLKFRKLDGKYDNIVLMGKELY